MPWSGPASPFGFGPAGSLPWLPQPPAWSSLTMETQDRDPASTLRLYRAVLAVRRTHPGLTAESFAWRDAPAMVLRFAREASFECVVNLGDEAVALPDGARMLLASSKVADGQLPGDAAAWLEVAVEPATR